MARRAPSGPRCSSSSPTAICRLPIPPRRWTGPTAYAHAQQVAGQYESSRHSVSNFFGLTDLISPSKVTVNPDTTITLPYLTALNGEPKHWREIKPFVWQEVDGKNVAGAKVENGRVEMLSGDEISPFIVFRPTRWWKSPSWLLPLAEFSLAVLVLTLIAWPLAALARRRYRRHLSAARPGPVSLPLGSHCCGLGLLLLLAGWTWQIQRMSTEVSALTSKSDPWLWLLQLLGLVVFLGAAGVALWNARLARSGKRPWSSQLWSGLLVLATVTLLYIAVVFKLVAFDINY